jgi:hypothetical protein
MGMLTNIGYHMAVQLGHQLRERYILQHRLLPAQYGFPASSRHLPASTAFPASGQGLLAETTASQRTVLTLQGVLSGLYPAGA